jgi:hypothetical protein
MNRYLNVLRAGLRRRPGWKSLLLALPAFGLIGLLIWGGPAASEDAAPAAAASSTKAKPAAKTAAAPSRTTPKSQSEENLVNREVYVYKTIDRRDPFASLLEGDFEATIGHPLLDVSSMKLVGIVWGKSDKFALIEDGRGHGHILRVGDPVINGYVVGLTQDELLIRQSSYGESQTVTIQLQRKEGGSDAP